MSLISELKDFQKEGVERLKNLESDYKGGFVLSATGTGKTVQILALILSNPINEKTLIVCPPHLVYNWANEIKKHTSLVFEKDVNVYYGSPRKINDARITITSYNLINSDIPSFDRVILDEGHYIRNRKTKVFQNVMTLTSNKKWLMTATPIMNSHNDLKAYFEFINKNQEMTFSPNCLRKYALCQKKDVIQLPKYTEEHCDLDLTKEQENAICQYYISFLQSIKNNLILASNAETRKEKSSYNCNVLVCFLKLRQICNYTKVYENDTANQIPTEDLCFICYQNSATHKSLCGHEFCKTCWYKSLNLNSCCPMCRKGVRISDLKQVKKQKNLPVKKIYSRKMEKVFEILDKHKESKIIISSQWRETLDYINKNLQEKGIDCIQLAGGQSNSVRQTIIDNFKDNKETKVLLVSLTACAEGLTLTESNVVIHFDYWWNLQKTSQLSDRVYRIGQEKEVFVYYLKIKDSIEDYMLEVNLKKQKTSKSYIYENTDDCIYTEGYKCLIFNWLENKVRSYTKEIEGHKF